VGWKYWEGWRLEARDWRLETRPHPQRTADGGGGRREEGGDQDSYSYQSHAHAHSIRPLQQNPRRAAFEGVDLSKGIWLTEQLEEVRRRLKRLLTPGVASAHPLGYLFTFSHPRRFSPPGALEPRSFGALDGRTGMGIGRAGAKDRSSSLADLGRRGMDAG
jgi:hypothetical protein